MTWTELGAGYRLLMDQVTAAASGGPGQPGDWVWWVLDLNNKVVVEQSVLCFGILGESDKFKAYSATEYRLHGQIESLIEFDELEWRLGALGL